MLRRFSWLCLVCCVAPSVLQAQAYPTDRGAWQVGGSVYLARFRTDGSDLSTTLLHIEPRIGYFVIRGLATNLTLALVRGVNESNSTWEYAVGPGLTYYFGRGQRRLYPYVGVRTLADFSRSHLTNSLGGTAELTNHSLTWLASGGAVVMLVRNVGVTGEISYSRAHVTTSFNNQDQRSSSEDVRFQMGVAVYLF